MASHHEIDAARAAMVDDLIARQIIRTPALERAFRTVYRDAFLPAPFAISTDALGTDFVETNDPRRVYADISVAVKREKSIACAAPGIVAEQIEQLAVEEGMRVLHVGTGSAYYTAILAELAGERGTVVGVEYEPDLAELSSSFLARAGYTNVTVREGDGAFGVPEAAPFDRILISAGVADIAPDWIAQLADDGRLVLPLCEVGLLGPHVGGGVVLTLHKRDNVLAGEFSRVAFFAPLHGAYAPKVEESAALAESLQHWYALEELLRVHLPLRVALKSDLPHPPEPDSVPWYMETRSAVLWIEPN